LRLKGRAGLINIRGERKEDFEGVRRVNEAAFGQPVEADLVAALRADGAVTVSLVAEVKGPIVGLLFRRSRCKEPRI
jgi:putative acetyltransferase